MTPTPRSIASLRAALPCLAMLALAPAARALDAPGLHWDILPSASLPTLPANEVGEAATGPIGATVANTNVIGLSHLGSVTVDYGRADVFNEIERMLSMQAGFGFCSPAPCGLSRGQWLDAITITAPGIANGTTGSFRATLVVDAALEAYVPPGWYFPSATVYGGYGVFVSIDGVLRDRITPSCYAAITPPCTTASTSRIHYPTGYPTTPQQVTPLGGLSGTFDIGPYDFVFGQPFELDVQATVNTSLARGINEFGDPYTNGVLSLEWGGVVEVHDAAGLGGNGIAPSVVQIATASGVDWVRAPEPGGLTPAALVALGAFGFGRRRAYLALPCRAQRIDRGSAARS